MKCLRGLKVDHQVIPRGCRYVVRDKGLLRPQHLKSSLQIRRKNFVVYRGQAMLRRVFDNACSPSLLTLKFEVAGIQSNRQNEMKLGFFAIAPAIKTCCRRRQPAGPFRPGESYSEEGEVLITTAH